MSEYLIRMYLVVPGAVDVVPTAVVEVVPVVTTVVPEAVVDPVPVDDEVPVKQEVSPTRRHENEGL